MQKSMRWSQSFIATLREVPADAEIVSHQLMVRAGMIRKVAAGIYTYLPLGLRSIKKLEGIVREEMNRAGAIELLMPAIQPAELWMQSGRWQQYGKELLRIKDRHERDFIFGPTHEEVITETVRDAISSYRDLPVNLYQIQTKFRDEVRPRFGLMRGREFIMKDAYSFHSSAESLDQTYLKMAEAYNAVFRRCGLDHVMVEAATGNIGGSASHEFMVLAAAGEDRVVRCPGCGYGANIELATARIAADENQPEMKPLEPVDTPGAQSIAAVARLLELPPSRLVKTLVFDTGSGPVMVLLRGDREANEVKIKAFLGVDELTLLEDQRFEQVVGGPPGYCGPVGAKPIRIVADHALAGMRNWVVGANRRDQHLVNVNPGRDFDLSEFADFTIVEQGDPCARCNTPLQIHRGIEVGHIFKLGTKYSAAMNCTFLDESGTRQPMIMGCYGLGIGRTVAAAIEQSYDADGIIWPLPIAPFEVLVTSAGKEAQVLKTAEEIYDRLRSEGVDVFYDDRDERPGVKFKDADLIGFPVRIVVGSKSLAGGQVEWSLRKDRQRHLATPGAAVESVLQLVRDARAAA